MRDSFASTLATKQTMLNSARPAVTTRLRRASLVGALAANLIERLAANVNPLPTLHPPTSRDIARRTQMQLCMIACSLVHIAYARSTNIDPSAAAGALPSNFSQPPQECCLGAPEAAHPLLAGSRLYSACEPNGWATFNLLMLAPDLNRDGGGNKEVIRPDCQAVAQRGRNSAPLSLPELGPCISRAQPSAPGGRSPAPASVPCYCLERRLQSR